MAGNLRFLSREEVTRMANPYTWFEADFSEKYGAAVEEATEGMSPDDMCRLFVHIPKALMQRDAEVILDVIRRAKSEAISVFKALPSDLFPEKGNEIIEILKAYEDKTYATDIMADIDGAPDRTARLEEVVGLIRTNRRQFGVRVFERYIGSTLLEDNIRNMNHEHKKERRIAVAINPVYDDPREKAFMSTKYRAQLEALGGAYKRFVFEAETKMQALDAIRNVGARYGPIETLIMGGHGTQKTMRLGLGKGEDSQNEEHVLSVNDEDELRQYAQYLAPRAVVGLVSCSTGEGRERGENLANAVARAFPGRTVYAPDRSSYAKCLRIEIEEGRVRQIDFGKEIIVETGEKGQIQIKEGLPITYQVRMSA